MSKDKGNRDNKKKLPNPVGKGAPSDYQASKNRSSSTDVVTNKKK